MVMRVLKEHLSSCRQYRCLCVVQFEVSSTLTGRWVARASDVFQCGDGCSVVWPNFGSLVMVVRVFYYGTLLSM